MNNVNIEQNGRPIKETKVRVIIKGDSFRGFSVNHFSSEWVTISAA
jgi:hypothetical protein